MRRAANSGCIANTSNERSTGIDQVNTALTQTDEVTQQNPALVEVNAATAKTLEFQAQAMDGRVAFFRFDNIAQRQVDAQPEYEAKPEHRPSSLLPTRGPAAKLVAALRPDLGLRAAA